jgi:Coenzyme F390 synthetase
MDYRKKLFTHRNPYDLENTDTLFLNAVKENISFHEANCKEYAQILQHQDFHKECLHSISDLYKIPIIPTLFLKSHELYSIAKNHLMINVTSSGTNGKQSHVGFDNRTLYYALRMVLKTFSYHKLISIIPTNYIVLGYEPSKHNQMGAAKTAYGTTLLAPALHREYAMKDTGTGYDLNIYGIKDALLGYSKMKFPVRFMGFPAYMYFLVKVLKESNIRLQLPKNSKVFLAGGWKQYFSEKVDKNELYQMIEQTLGIKKKNCKEFFGAVEHPIVYCDCKNHHFHVPVYSRVIIRDVNTLLPVENGKVGLLSLVTPLVGSVPLTHVITDDLAVMYDGGKCGCGITSPYFEILGRVGLQDIKTCAAGAAELLGGMKL